MVEALADRLKSVRNRRADELGLDRGTLLSNAVVTAIALDGPQDVMRSCRPPRRTSTFPSTRTYTLVSRSPSLKNP